MEEIILQFFEGIRNPYSTVFFGVFSLLGEALVVGGIAVLVFWLAPRKTGEQLLVTVLTSFPLNSLLKFVVARPRPYVSGVVSYLEPPFFADSLVPNASYPSGHTQASGSLLFAAASATKRILAWILSFVIVLLVMVSRLYFGAHYPTDVLAGLLLGAAAAVFWAAIYRYAYRARHFVLLGFAVLSLIPCFFPDAAHDYIQAAGLLTGATAALFAGRFTLTAHEVEEFPRRLWRIPVGVAIAGAVFAMTLLFPEGEWFSLLKWFLIAFAALYCAPYAFERLDI